MNELERKPPAAERPWTLEEIKHTIWLFTASRNRVLPCTLHAVIERWAEEADQ